MFDKTWDKIASDFNRLNPFTSAETEKYMGHNRGLDSLNNFGDGIAGKKYSIDQYTYPLDLMDGSNKANAPYVMFYINERVGRKLNGKSSETIADFREDDPTNGKKFKATNILGMDNKTAAVAMGSTSTLLTTALGAAAGGLLGGVAGATGGKVAGAAAGAVITSTMNNISVTSETKRLKAAIAMHMPNQLDIRYNMAYKSDNAWAFLAATKVAGETGTGAVNAATTQANSEDPLAKLTQSIASGANSYANSIGTSAALQLLPGGDTLSNATGIAPNPMIQSVFEGVEPRTFSMAYSFFPRSRAELDNIKNIITLLKLHMHPTIKDNSDSFLFVYPSEFDIVYYVGAEINEHLHRHAKCALINMSLNYTPNNQYTYFAGDAAGAPIQIDVRMDFRELDILTAEDIAKGY